MTPDEIGVVGVLALVVVNLVQAVAWVIVTRRLTNTIAALAARGRDLAAIERATNPPRPREKPDATPALDERV